MAFFQTVVRDFRAQVMNVMKTDIPREPLQDFWKLIIGTSVYRGLSIIPLIAVVPISVFELMLNIEYPHPGS